LAVVEEARRVLARLDRIDKLRGRAGADILLGEVRLLLIEAEEWVRADRADGRATDAVEGVRAALRERASAPGGPKRTLVA
jgi:hypothetical protein